MLVPPGEIHNLGCLGLGDLVSVDSANPDAALMHMQHDVHRFLPALIEEPFEDERRTPSECSLRSKKDRVSCEPDILDHVGGTPGSCTRAVATRKGWQTAPTGARRLAERCAQLPPSKKLWTISERAM